MFINLVLLLAGAAIGVAGCVLILLVINFTMIRYWRGNPLPLIGFIVLVVLTVIAWILSTANINLLEYI